MSSDTACQPIDSLLPFAVNGTLSSAEQARVSEHIAICECCAAELASWQSVFSMVQSGSGCMESAAASLSRSLVAFDSFLNRVSEASPVPSARASAVGAIRAALGRQSEQIAAAHSLLVGSMSSGEDSC